MNGQSTYSAKVSTKNIYMYMYINNAKSSSFVPLLRITYNSTCNTQLTSTTESH